MLHSSDTCGPLRGGKPGREGPAPGFGRGRGGPRVSGEGAQQVMHGPWCAASGRGAQSVRRGPGSAEAHGTRGRPLRPGRAAGGLQRECVFFRAVPPPAMAAPLLGRAAAKKKKGYRCRISPATFGAGRAARQAASPSALQQLQPPRGQDHRSPRLPARRLCARRSQPPGAPLARTLGCRRARSVRGQRVRRVQTEAAPGTAAAQQWQPEQRPADGVATSRHTSACRRLVSVSPARQCGARACHLRSCARAGRPVLGAALRPEEPPRFRDRCQKPGT